MTKRTSIITVSMTILLCSLFLPGEVKVRPARTPRETAKDPLNATYVIEGLEIRLQDGQSMREAAPGSASQVWTTVVGRPATGDLDGDGADDAALFLSRDSAGSGVFYYVVAALQRAGQFQGTNAVPIGARIAPHDVWISHEMVTVNYRDRRPNDPMSAVPLVDRSRQLILEDGRLKLIEGQSEGEEALPGWVTIDRGVRSFKPCSLAVPLWIMDDSPIIEEITAAYGQPRPGSASPLFAILAGKIIQPSNDGPGAIYKPSFLATQLLRVFPRGTCQSDLIVVDAPAPGESIGSPLKISGRARGKWFFEGDFPVVLKDSVGRLIAQGYCSATGEWMTEHFVPFEGTLEFRAPSSVQSGTLVLRRNNPSNHRRDDDALEIAVSFE